MATFNLHMLAAICGVSTLLIASASPVAAQDDGTKSRAEVKAATRQAAKTHMLEPAGEAAEYQPPTKSTSTKTRAQRKAETLQARKEGTLYPTGEAADDKRERLALSAHSTKTRAQRKAETLAAIKAHQLIPAGEGPYLTPSK